MNKWVLIRFACYYGAYLAFKLVMNAINPSQWVWAIEIPVCLFYLVLSAVLSWGRKEEK